MRYLTKALVIGLFFLSTQAFAKINVYACEPEWQALVQVIGGEHVSIMSATTAFQDPHYIEARPSLIAGARRADLLVCTGAELEVGWLPVLIRQAGNARIRPGQLGHFLVTEYVDLIEVPTALDRSMGDIHAAGNPHVHWSPHRLITIAQALSARLQTIDPNHAVDYQQALADFESRWQANIARWQTTAQVLNGKQVIVYHKSWSYLLEWLGITIVGDLEPKPGLPPTSKHLASLLQTVANTSVDAIVINHYQNDKGARWLSKKADIPVVRLPFTVGATDDITSLESLYDVVLMTLRDQLK